MTTEDRVWNLLSIFLKVDSSRSVLSVISNKSLSSPSHLTGGSGCPDPAVDSHQPEGLLSGWSRLQLASFPSMACGSMGQGRQRASCSVLKSTQVSSERAPAGVASLSIPSAFFCSQHPSFPPGKHPLLTLGDQYLPCPKIRHVTPTQLECLSWEPSVVSQATKWVAVRTELS